MTPLDVPIPCMYCGAAALPLRVSELGQYPEHLRPRPSVWYICVDEKCRATYGVILT